MAWAVFALSALLFTAFTAFAAPHVRGSDQYWYAADLETLARGGPHQSNSGFAARAMATARPEPTPFVHDTLNLYLAWPLARAVGAERGWVFLNILASLVTAAFIAACVRKLSGDLRYGLVAGAVYLLMPITLWQSTQALIEASTTPFVILAAWAFLCAPATRWRDGVMLGALIAAVWCRSSFLPLLLLVPLLPFVEERPRTRATWVRAAILGVVAVGAILSAKVLFRQAMPGSFRTVLLNGLPGRSNMDFLLAMTPHPASAGLVVQKFVSNLREQFWPPIVTSQVFYLPFNALSLVALFVAWRTRENPLLRRAGLVTAALLGLHLVTILLHQNQFRYLLLPLPMLVVCAAALLAGRPQNARISQIAVALCLVGFAAVDLQLTRRIRAESHAEHARVVALGAWADTHIATTDTVLACWNHAGPPLLVAYALRPRSVVFLNEDEPAERYQQLAARTRATWTLCGPESSLEPALHLRPIHDPTFAAMLPGVRLSALPALNAPHGSTKLD